MWIQIWAVTIAMAIGLSVMATLIESENDGATFGRYW
jgi:hypothetical protein